MIGTRDQEELFALISRYLTRDVTCYAIGGTAMMFYGYKTATKDIDLVFRDARDRDAFIAAIRELGYKEMGLQEVYDEKRRTHSGRPLMFTRGDERFDLFVRSVFGFTLADDLTITQRHDFPEHLTVNILPKEHLALLKAITGRATDHEDIVTMLKVEKTLDWDRIIDLAIEQNDRNAWILIDLEETLKRLKELTFTPKRHFKRLYDGQR